MKERIVPPPAALSILSTAIRQGRMIIPVVGAGVSASSGIPTPLELARYLAKILYLQIPVATLRKGWPDVRTLHVLVRRSLNIAANVPTPDCDDIIREVALREIDDLRILEAEDLGTQRISELLASRWRDLLLRLTHGDAEAIRKFHEQIVANRHPSRGHQFIAHLTELLGWRWILTTNFDCFLETMLREQGLAPSVVDASIPDTLKHLTDAPDRPTVLKLNGDSPMLRAKSFFDAERVSNLIPDDAVFLGLGLRCRDRRVAELLTNIASVADRQMVWVCRHGLPAHITTFSATDNTTCDVTRYADASYFLQDLYLRTATAFPTASKPYSVLTSVIPDTRSSATLASTEASDAGLRVSANAITETFVAFAGDERGAGTSSFLADFAKQMSCTHRVIWCDAEEFTSAESLVAYVLDETRRLDPSIPPLALPTVDLYDESNRLDGGQLAKRLQRLAEVLRSRRFLIAIDSLSEFGRAHTAHHVGAGVLSDFRVAITGLYGLLKTLASGEIDIGASRIAVALSPVSFDGYREPNVVDDWALDAESTHVTPNSIPRGTTKIGADDEQGDSFDHDSFQQTEALLKESLPSMINDYSVGTVVGIGGNAVVVLLNHPTIEQEHVAKILKRNRTFGSEADDFFEEVKLVSRLRHPAILPVHSTGYLADGRPYMITDFVNGMSFRSLLDRSAPSVSLRLAVSILSEVAEGLHCAHEAGLIHRDVKPANILVDTDQKRAFLSDFGLARAADSPQNGLGISGTASYMSPEQAQGDNLTPASDIFSLSIVLYECLTGQNPFQGSSPAESLKLVVNHHPKNASAVDSGLPSQLAEICQRGLSKSPETRFETAQEFSLRLRSWLDEDAEHTRLLNNKNSPPSLAATEFQRLESDLVRLDQTSSRVLVVKAHTRAYEYVRKPVRNWMRHVLATPEEREKTDDYADIIAQSKTPLGRAVEILWPRIKSEYRKILAVAAVFRRPRSIAALRRIGAECLGDSSTSLDQCFRRTGYARRPASTFEQQYPGLPNSPELQLPSNPLLDALNEDRFGDVDEVIKVLEEADFLVSQSGGHYWMHSTVRNYIYEQLRHQASSGLGSLHETIGDFYYRDLFYPSGDPNAFLEFLYHGTAALRHSKNADTSRRANSLLKALRRDSFAIIRGEGLSRYIEWLYAMKETEIPKLRRRDLEQSTRELLAEFQGTLCDQIANAWMFCGNYNLALATRLAQIEDRLSEIGLHVRSDSRWTRDRPVDRTNAGGLVRYVKAIIRAVDPDVATSRVHRRLFDHIFGVALCLQGMHLGPQAQTLFEALANLAESALLTCHGDDRSLIVLQGKCRVRHLTSMSGSIDTWSPWLLTREKIATIDEQMRQTFLVISQYPGDERSLYLRHLAHLHLVEAQLMYTLGDFSEAHRKIDSARASLLGMASTQSVSGLAVCQLKRAECAMLHADSALRLGKTLDAARQDVDFTALSRSRLALAEDAIRKARTLINAITGGVWYWAEYYRIKAQHKHELLLHMLETGEKWGDTLIKEGVAAVRAGMENVATDNVQRQKLEMLWWQLYVCHSVYGCKASSAPSFGKSWDSWVALNDDVGSRWLIESVATRHRRQKVSKRWNAVIESGLELTDPEGIRNFAIELQRGIFDEKSVAWEALKKFQSTGVEEVLAGVNNKASECSMTVRELSGMISTLDATASETIELLQSHR